jgi:hypothetical protein
MPPTLSVDSTLSNPALTLRVSDLTLRASDSLSYSWLDRLWRRSRRNRSWGRLSVAERGMFRCGLWVARARGKISSMRLMVHVLRIALKLLETHRNRIVSAGRRRALHMFELYAKPGGVFTWAPWMREWLYDPGYVRYLGVLEVNH